jgi:hypothetical protein
LVHDACSIPPPGKSLLCYQVIQVAYHPRQPAPQNCSSSPMIFDEPKFSSSESSRRSVRYLCLCN